MSSTRFHWAETFAAGGNVGEHGAGLKVASVSEIGSTKSRPQDTLAHAAEELAAFLRRDPSCEKAWRTLFTMHNRLGDVSPAVALALELIEGVPTPEDVFLLIGKWLCNNGFHESAVAIYESIRKHQPDARSTYSELLVYKQLYGGDDAWQEYELWNERFVAPLVGQNAPAATSPDADRLLRIGFLSNDFVGYHSLNAVMAPWFLRKENRSNEYIFYSNGFPSTSPHRVFFNAADRFVDVHNLTDQELNRRIRDDRIDILVDMVSHSERNRLMVYALKPAPIIATWIGVGIATGLETVDYLIADPYFVPQEVMSRYREKIVHFPKAAMVWCPPKVVPPTGPVPSLSRGYVVFGNLNRIVKFHQETIAGWARVLKSVPSSRFLLKDKGLHGKNFRRVHSMFAAYGIGPERLILRGGSNQVEHLATYNEIDVTLDCYPQNGGISTLEALWMGCPVVSYCHSLRPSCRIGRYILENVGLPALVSDTEDEFVNLAVGLAQNPDLLVSFRRSLRQSVARSALCDVRMFQRNVSTAFRHMWKRYCDGLPPESFTVAEG